MRMSVVGRAAIKWREGEKLSAYKDSVGIWTIGVGHTLAAGAPEVKAGMKITAAQSDEILARDLEAVEKDVTDVVKVPLNQNQFDDLSSLHFNIGPGSFRSATLLKKLNAKDYAGAADQFLVWNKGTINGKKVAINGLTIRRKDERAQFLSTTIDEAPAPDQHPNSSPPSSRSRSLMETGSALSSRQSLPFSRGKKHDRLDPHRALYFHWLAGVLGADQREGRGHPYD